LANITSIAKYNTFNGANAIPRAHQAWLEGSITETGIMIHYVIAKVDLGTPIVERTIELEHPRDEDLKVLEARIHSAEHEAIVQGTKIATENLWKRRMARDSRSS
jgi:phosphoribosylglycinamide formyltransferase